MKPATMAPAYVVLYPRLAEAARSCGYALAVHGTLGRDLDLVAIPWTAEATSAEDVVRAMAEVAARRAGTDLVIGYTPSTAPPAPHGRVGFSIPFRSGGDTEDSGYLDVSVMPRALRASVSGAPGAGGPRAVERCGLCGVRPAEQVGTCTSRLGTLLCAECARDSVCRHGCREPCGRSSAYAGCTCDGACLACHPSVPPSAPGVSAGGEGES